MRTFLSLSAVSRLVNVNRPISKADLRMIVCEAIERYQCCKVMAAAGGIGLS